MDKLECTGRQGLSYVPYKSVNPLRPSDAYICVSKLSIIGSDNGLSGAKSLSEPVLEFC